MSLYPHIPDIWSEAHMTPEGQYFISLLEVLSRPWAENVVPPFVPRLSERNCGGGVWVRLPTDREIALNGEGVEV